MAKVRNGYRNSQGYIVERFICEHAPTNQTRNGKNLDGHVYTGFSYGNGAGYRWGSHMRTQTCHKCGGRVIPIDHWAEHELPVVENTYEFRIENLWVAGEFTQHATFKGCTAYECDRQAAAWAAKMTENFGRGVRFNNLAGEEVLVGQSLNR